MGTVQSVVFFGTLSAPPLPGGESVVSREEYLGLSRGTVRAVHFVITEWIRTPALRSSLVE